MKHKRTDFIIPLIIIGASIFLYLQTNQIPAPRFEPLGSAFFPRLMLISIIFLSLILIFKNFISIDKKALKEHVSVPPANKSKDEVIPRKIQYVLGTIFIWGLYILLITITDFSYLVLTFLFLFIFAWFLAFWRIRAAYHALGLAFIVTIIIYLIFGQFLKIFFP